MLNKNNLHFYQRKIIDLSNNIPNMGLLMAPGLGKSVTALTILKNSPPGKILVIAPKRVAESVWAQECQKWEHLSSLRVALILGNPEQRLKAIYSDSDVYVINVENVPWLVEHWPVGLFDYLIIDESSRFKDPSTKRFKAIKKVLRQFKRRIICTGTPTPQGVGDLWSQIGLLDLGERLEPTLTKFRDKYMYPAEKNRHTNVVYKWAVRPGLEKEILQKIEDICFSLRAEDYLQLPKLTKLYHEIELDKQAMTQYKQLKKEMVSEIQGQQITAVTAAALANKLLQFTSGTVYTEDGESALAQTTKIEFLEELLEENNAPTLIFYHYKTALDTLLKAFPEAQILDDSNIEKWRQGKIKILLAHPQSGGIGLNLQCNEGEIAQCVWYDLPWSSENYIQANARIYRQGQTKPVIIHHLVAKKTIDEQVIRVLEGKIDVQDAILDALKA